MEQDYLSLFIEESRDQLRIFADHLIRLEQVNDPSTIASLFRAAHSIKGMAMTMEFTCMSALTHAAEDLLDDVRTGRLPLSPVLVDTLLETQDTLTALLDQIERTGHEGALDTAALHARLLLARQGPASDSTRKPVEPRATTTPENPSQETAPAVNGSAGGNRTAPLPTTVRVQTSQLADLITFASTLSVHFAQVEQRSQELADTTLAAHVEALRQTVQQVETLAALLSTEPVATVFYRFPRMVQETARKLGKQVELRMTGEDTRIDRRIVEEIADPIMHMLRNSLDHGLELPEDRLRSGKSSVGHIELDATARDNRVVISVTDDGRGIDLAQVAQKARERGLLGQEEVQSEQTLHSLLFTPGFSTAATVSTLSGRGVGLDVVRTKVEALAGTVEVFSQPGVGTRFVLSVPLTMTIGDGQLGRIQEQQH